MTLRIIAPEEIQKHLNVQISCMQKVYNSVVLWHKLFAERNGRSAKRKEIREFLHSLAKRPDQSVQYLKNIPPSWLFDAIQCKFSEAFHQHYINSYNTDGSPKDIYTPMPFTVTDFSKTNPITGEPGGNFSFPLRAQKKGDKYYGYGFSFPKKKSHCIKLADAVYRFISNTPGEEICFPVQKVKKVIVIRSVENQKAKILLNIIFDN